MRKMNWKLIAIVTVVAAAASGCATKKFVHARVDPVGQRVGTLETTTQEQGEDVAELQQQVSRVDERATTADQKADRAGQAAEQANQEATRAGSKAQEAMSEADRAKQGIDKLSARVDGLQTYQETAKDAVLFDFDSSKLTDDAKMKLDALAQRLDTNGSYAIEVQGFTDKTGSADYNVALSQKRAETVVRYLTGELDVPLHRIYTLGLGSVSPAADNKTREGRKQNRRVEVRLLVAGEPAMAAANAR